jgi:hypothetical protein
MNSGFQLTAEISMLVEEGAGRADLARNKRKDRNMKKAAFILK